MDVMSVLLNRSKDQSKYKTEKLDKWYSKLMQKHLNDKNFFSDIPGKKLWQLLHSCDKGYNLRLKWLNKNLKEDLLQ